MQISRARDISYAPSAQTRGGRTLIRLMENTTGRLSLLRRARGYEHDIASGRSLFDVMVERYGLTLELAGGRLETIPNEGPLIVIANHPYGILDGLMLGHMLARRRSHFRILANSVFCKSEDLQNWVLPVSFDAAPAALALNLQTRKVALDYLAEGGAIGVFPGGTVSTAARPFSQPMDPGWRGFTARMISRSDATVVPIYFDGHTSRLFQIASHLHVTLRMGLLMKEFRRRLDAPVRVVVGDPIDRDELRARRTDSKAMMDFLRKATYDLAPGPERSVELGYEFEERRRSRADV